MHRYADRLALPRKEAQRCRNEADPVSTASGKAGRPVKVAKRPIALAVSPDGKTVYVASQDAQEVTPISTSTGKAGVAIKLSDDPVALAIAP
jgi:DNA-binding beta-propeller fold protein YncE